MFDSVFIAIFAFLASWYLRYIWKKRKSYISSWNTPGPLALPFIGNLYMFNPSDIHALTTKGIEVVESYPDIMRFWYGPVLMFILRKPEYIQKVLNNALERHYTLRYNNFPGVKGILAAQVGLWKRHRKLMMPAFKQSNLNFFVDIFNKKSHKLCKELEKYEKKGISLFEPLSRCMMELTYETTVGLEIDTQTVPFKYGLAIDKLFELIAIRSVNLFYHNDFIWRSLYGRTWDESMRVCMEFTTHIIRRKLDEVNASKDVIVNSEEMFTILDLLMETKNVTEEELIDEISTILATGSHTTAKTLEFVMLTLGMHQDIQEKVLEEVMQIVGPDRQVEPNDIPKMKYTEMVLKETLRIFPTAPFTLRIADTDSRLDEKYIIPEGSTILITSMVIHRNPTYWPDPFKFDPDRFLPENMVNRNPCTYIPFMSGPRNCIGGQFAKMAIMTVLVHLIRKYKFFTEYKTLKEVLVTPMIILKLKDGSKVWIERRR